MSPSPSDSRDVRSSSSCGGGVFPFISFCSGISSRMLPIPQSLSTLTSLLLMIINQWIATPIYSYRSVLVLVFLLGVVCPSCPQPTVTERVTQRLVLDDDLPHTHPCGNHPLKGILERLERKQPNLSYEQVVTLLAHIRIRQPHLWKAYESALAQYSNCKLMASSGSLG